MQALLASLQQGRLQRLHYWLYHRLQGCANRWHRWRLHHTIAGHCLSYACACALGLSASGTAGWVWLVQPAQAALLQSQADIAMLKKTYVIKLQNAPSAALERAQQSRRLLAQQESMLSDDGEQPAAMRKIDALGRAHHLAFTLFKPEPRTTGNISDSMLFSVIGTFENIVRFTEDIAQLPRIVILDRLQLQAVDGSESSAVNGVQSGSPMLILRAAANTYPHSLAMAAAAALDLSTVEDAEKNAEKDVEKDAEEQAGYDTAD